MKKRNFIHSLKYAGKGLQHFILSEPNSRIHLLAMIVVVAGGCWLRIDRFSWLIVILCIGLVLAAEIFNTVIEKIMDLISPEKNEKVRIIKDMAAAAVLVAAVVSVVCAALIFWPILFS